MPPQLNTLASVGDPTTAYALFLAGGFLVILECLRPGTVWAGITGAVLVVISLDSLSKWPWTWYGLAFLGLAGYFGFRGVRRSSQVSRILSAVAFGAGSAGLIQGGVHIAATGMGVLFALTCNWLLWIARRARLAKQEDVI